MNRAQTTRRRRVADPHGPADAPPSTGRRRRCLPVLLVPTLGHPVDGRAARGLRRPVHRARTARPPAGGRTRGRDHRRPHDQGRGRVGPGQDGVAGTRGAGRARLDPAAGGNREGLCDRGRAGGHPDLLRKPGPSASDCKLLQHQHGLVPAHGTGGYAAGGDPAEGLTASQRDVDGRRQLCLVADEWRARLGDHGSA